MERTQKMKWYIGRLVRLIADVPLRGGRVWRKGRVFRIEGHWRGRLNLFSPGRTPRMRRFPGERPVILKANFADVELVNNDLTGFCRVCGCVDQHGCDGGCSWIDHEHTLCSACV